jgi:hypothetical protein
LARASTCGCIANSIAAAKPSTVSCPYGCFKHIVYGQQQSAPGHDDKVLTRFCLPGVKPVIRAYRMTTRLFYMKNRIYRA